jgi:hypothetical protein
MGGALRHPAIQSRQDSLSTGGGRELRLSASSAARHKNLTGLALVGSHQRSAVLTTESGGELDVIKSLNYRVAPHSFCARQAQVDAGGYTNSILN